MAERSKKMLAAEHGDDALAMLYRRPGFLLRRANQIAAALFVEAMGEIDITTTQYGTLVVLSSRQSLDQIGLARTLGLDRSTAGLVVANLEKRGLVTRTPASGDRRRRLLVLTEAGSRLLEQVHERAKPVPARAMEIFTEIEQEQFLHLLSKFVLAFNASVRTPLYREQAAT